MTTVEVGQGAFRYRVVPGWPRWAEADRPVEVAAVATDSTDRVYLFQRGGHPVQVFTPDGEPVDSWGDTEIERAHGLTLGADDSVYCVDDLDHTVKKFSRDGRRLLTLGNSGQPSDTGATSVDYREIQCAAGPFNFPTDLALGPQGELFVTDGYGNAKVHKFSPEGELLLSWGEPGSAPGQFHVPHGVAVDSAGRVYVADRENSRIQRFDLDGGFLDEWTDIARPCQVFIDPEGNVFVAELGYRAGLWPGTSAPSPTATGGRVSIFSAEGVLLSRWGGGDDPSAPGDFFAPHDIWLDGQGSIYLAEVWWSAGGKRGMVPASHRTIQKFVRVKTTEPA